MAHTTAEMWIGFLFVSYLGLCNLAIAKIASRDFIQTDENSIPTVLRGTIAKETDGQDAKDSFLKDQVIKSESKSTGLILQDHIQQQLHQIETYEEQMKQIDYQLSEIDTSDIPDLQNAIDFARVNLKNGLHELPKVVELLHGVMADINANTLPSLKKDVGTEATIALIHSRRLEGEKSGDFSEEEEHYNDSSSRKKSYHNHQHKRHFESMPHRYRSLFEMQDAMLNGDHEFVNRKLSSMHMKMHTQGPYHQFHGRRNKFEDSGDQKYDQCSLLADCASDMTLYDIFVFFYSDDIDDEDGSIDDVEDIVTFNEGDGITLVRNNITTAVNEAISFLEDSFATFEQNGKSFSDITISTELDACDKLLQLFHRNIEVGMVENWEGAMVNQVCLAQGTTVYVKPSEIAKIDGTVALQSFQDFMDCAEELYNGPDRKLDPRYEDEQFVFGPKDDRKIPYMYDSNARNEFGQYTDNSVLPFTSKALVTSCKLMKLL